METKPIDETAFWASVAPLFDKHDIITIDDLQLALEVSEKEAEAVAAHFCNKHELFRVVTRVSYGYIRTDPEEDRTPICWCGTIKFRRMHRQPDKSLTSESE